MSTKRKRCSPSPEVLASDPQSTTRSPHCPVYINFLNDCLRTCNKTHAHVCVPASISDCEPDGRPAYLIDVAQNCIVEVKHLLEHPPDAQPLRYLALSYVWPKKKRGLPLCLKRTNLTRFKTSGFFKNRNILKQIPAVVQHAIGVTIRLHERYLWIDRFCIVQDDPNIQLQISRMNDIYGEAYLTIIAASSRPSYEARFEASEWPMFEVSNEDQLDSDCHKSRIVELQAALATSEWSGRGWTYQEEILSRRSAIFTEYGLYFDCQCATWDGIVLKPGDVGTPKYGPSRHFLSKWWPDFESYINVVCLYNGRDFTYPQDGLKGISATLSALSPAFPGGFIAGLPLVFLDHALLWQPFKRAKRRAFIGQNGKPTGEHTGLPSWSWCSWQCPVDPFSLVSGLAYIYDSETQERVGSWRTKSIVEWHPSYAIKQDAKQTLDYLSTSQVNATSLSKHYTGWRMHGSAGSPGKDGTYFTYLDHQVPKFRYPIPLSDCGERIRLEHVSLHISAFTQMAAFSAAAILEPKEAWYGAWPKTSVFDHPVFTGLGRSDTEQNHERASCFVLVLRQQSGAFAGLLRMMYDEQPREGTLNLVAISAGSATAKDLENSLEYSVYDPRRRSARNTSYDLRLICSTGKTALDCELIDAFENMGIDTASEEIPVELGEDLHPLTTLPKKWKHWFLRDGYDQNTPEDFVCKFYNVLWVEEKDGICYRRACGWVPERIWEANATKRHVTLG
jgi:hypothetical protein